MLYNSFPFIFVFLPICLIGFFAIGLLRSGRPQLLWLMGMSCVFYAYWQSIYLVLLLGSLCVNFLFAQALLARHSKGVLAMGIVFNVFVLGYFKYRAFVLANVSDVFQLSLAVPKLALPLGISFITFQKIAYLVDVFRKRATERDLLRFATFITFFPQLIAGPIVHYAPLMRQFPHKGPLKGRWIEFNIGLTFFIVGLVKKVVIADTIALYADPLFTAADAGVRLGFFDAWVAALAYAFEIYFDFSGYSDMAIGLARMLGIRLPINFNSPYKARSIIEFWRRWHITLSFFLRDFIYIPLGGSRRGRLRQLSNIMITMLLGGLWHGASWTFVLWGGVHGVFLVINHVWSSLTAAPAMASIKGRWLYRVLSLLVVFLSVVAAWSLFRAQTFAGAAIMLKALVGIHGWAGGSETVTLPRLWLIQWMGEFAYDMGVPTPNPYSVVRLTAAIACAILLGFVMLLPNSQQIMSYKARLPRSGLPAAFRWRPNVVWFVWTSILFYTALIVMTQQTIRPFTYFAF